MTKTTLRQIIYKALKEVLKNENLLLRNELEQLTNYILDNSSLELTEESIYMQNGNSLGIGNENKDKVLMLPKFLSFKFKKRAMQEVVNGGGWNWTLQSFQIFKDLESSLGYHKRSELKPVVIIDGEFIDYEYDSINENIDGFVNPYGGDVKWKQEIYSATYEFEGMIVEDKFNSKGSLEEHIISLVNANEKDINVKNIIANKEMGFCISGTLFDTNVKEEEKRIWLVWQEQEESEYWDNIRDWDF